MLAISNKRAQTSDSPESLSAWVKDSPARENYLEAFRRSDFETLSAAGSSRATVVISSTVPKHFEHQFSTLVDLLNGYMGKPYLSLSSPQFGHILL